MRSRSASSSQVVRKRYSAIARDLRLGRRFGSVPGGRLAVPELRAGPLDDLGEPDHRDGVLLADRARVERLEEVDGLVAAAELGVVVLHVTGGELRDLLHLNVVDHGREDLLARLVPVADRDPDDLPALVLPRLVAQPDRRGLPPTAQLVDEDRRIEVEDEER